MLTSESAQVSITSERSSKAGSQNQVGLQAKENALRYEFQQQRRITTHPRYPSTNTSAIPYQPETTYSTTQATEGHIYPQPAYDTFEVKVDDFPHVRRASIYAFTRLFTQDLCHIRPDIALSGQDLGWSTKFAKRFKSFQSSLSGDLHSFNTEVEPRSTLETSLENATYETFSFYGDQILEYPRDIHVRLATLQQTDVPEIWSVSQCLDTIDGFLGGDGFTFGRVRHHPIFLDHRVIDMVVMPHHKHFIWTYRPQQPTRFLRIYPDPVIRFRPRFTPISQACGNLYDSGDFYRPGQTPVIHHSRYTVQTDASYVTCAPPMTRYSIQYHKPDKPRRALHKYMRKQGGVTVKEPLPQPSSLAKLYDAWHKINKTEDKPIVTGEHSDTHHVVIMQPHLRRRVIPYSFSPKTTTKMELTAIPLVSNQQDHGVESLSVQEDLQLLTPADLIRWRAGPGRKKSWKKSHFMKKTPSYVETSDRHHSWRLRALNLPFYMYKQAGGSNTRWFSTAGSRNASRKGPSRQFRTETWLADESISPVDDGMSVEWVSSVDIDLGTSASLDSDASGLPTPGSTSYQTRPGDGLIGYESFRGAILGSQFEILGLLRNETHFDLYEVRSLQKGDVIYHVNAYRLDGIRLAKLKEYRMRSLKRKQNSPYHVCSIHQNGRIWVVTTLIGHKQHPTRCSRHRQNPSTATGVSVAAEFQRGTALFDEGFPSLPGLHSVTPKTTPETDRVHQARCANIAAASEDFVQPKAPKTQLVCDFRQRQQKEKRRIRQRDARTRKRATERATQTPDLSNIPLRERYSTRKVNMQMAIWIIDDMLRAIEAEFTEIVDKLDITTPGFSSLVSWYLREEIDCYNHRVEVEEQPSFIAVARNWLGIIMSEPFVLSRGGAGLLIAYILQGMDLLEACPPESEKTFSLPKMIQSIQQLWEVASLIESTMRDTYYRM